MTDDSDLTDKATQTIHSSGSSAEDGGAEASRLDSDMPDSVRP